MENTAEIEKKIQVVLEHVRPYLKIDKGDIKLIGVSEDGIVKVEFLGACKDCAMSPMTLRAGIERAILHEVPEVRRIESVKT